MQIKGKLIAILAMVDGVSKATGKNWVSQEIVVEYKEDYNNEKEPLKKAHLKGFGEQMVNVISTLKIEDEVQVFFNLTSNESQNQRWFTSCNIWRLELLSSQQQQTQQTQPQEQPQESSSDYTPSSDYNEDDDAPF